MRPPPRKGMGALRERTSMQPSSNAKQRLPSSNATTPALNRLEAQRRDLEQLFTEHQPGAGAPRRDLPAKPGADYVELRRTPRLSYIGHAPLRLQRSHAELLAKL